MVEYVGLGRLRREEVTARLAGAQRLLDDPQMFEGVSDCLVRGMTPAQAARVLGVSVAEVRRWYRVVRRVWLARRMAAMDEYAAEEVAKLDRLERAVWDRAVAGDVKAIDRMLRIMEMRMRLMGFDRVVDVRSYVVEQAKRLGIAPEAVLSMVEQMTSEGVVHALPSA